MAADVLVTIFVMAFLYLLAQTCTKYREKHPHIRIPAILFPIMRFGRARGFTASAEDEAQLLGFLYFLLIAMPAELVLGVCVFLRIMGNPLYDMLTRSTVSIVFAAFLIWMLLTVAWDILIAPFIKK